MLNRKANVSTRNPAVNAIEYLTPGLAILWLMLLTQTEVSRPEYLLAGATATIGANLLANLPPLRRRRNRKRDI